MSERGSNDKGGTDVERMWNGMSERWERNGNDGTDGRQMTQYNDEDKTKARDNGGGHWRETKWW